MNQPIKKNNTLQTYFKDFNIRQCMEIVNIIVFCILIHLAYMGFSYIDNIKTAMGYHGMQNIPDNSNLIGYRLSNWGTIKYKDVVYYRSPFLSGKKASESRIFGRVIGLPGDTIEIRSGEVYRNNYKVSEGEYLGQTRFSDSYAPIIVPRNKVYVLLDNRTSGMKPKKLQESDSRHLGLIMGTSIEGTR